MAAVVATPLSERLPGPGQEGPLVLAASLLLMLSAVVAALALPRMAWPRPAMRRAAFGLGIGLAIALAAVVVELERWGPLRFTSFHTLCAVALFVVPFADQATGVLSDHPRLASLTPPVAVSILIYPASVMNGWRWALASTGFLFAFVVLALVYQLVVVVREGRSGALYLSASLLVLAAGLARTGSFDPERGAAWGLALLAFGFMLWAVDLYDRAGRVARARAQ